jgi:four helix bundle protein
MEKQMKNSVLSDKTVDFAVRIVKFYKYLCDEKKEYVLSKQILRSGTSIGANVRESKNAQSNADFINKLSIALKEADETQYWLEIMVKSDLIRENQVEALNSDLKEIIAMLVASIKTLKQKSESRK